MNNDLRPINTIPNFKRFCMTIGELPTSYLETMSYYEMLVWFTEYMKNTIIPTINNNGLAVQELQDKYIELKNYVDDYFTNLDVQQEINNKLDAMAESGQLTDIIAQYLGLAGVLAFNTVNDMKSATNLVNGSTCRTLGYYNINDGGKAIYKIRNITNEDIVDDVFIIALNDQSLIAELIYEEINTKQIGCYGDNIHDDTSKINYVLNKLKLNNGGTLIFSDGIYKITQLEIDAFNGNVVNNITLKSQTKYGAKLYGSGDNIILIKNHGEGIIIDGLFLYGNTTNIGINSNCSVANSIFKNIKIENVYDGININYSHWLLTLSDIVIKPIHNGLYLKTEGTSSSLNNIYVNGGNGIAYFLGGAYSSASNLACDNFSGIPYEFNYGIWTIESLGCENCTGENIIKLNEYCNVVINNVYIRNVTNATLYMLNLRSYDNLIINNFRVNSNSQTNLDTQLLTFGNGYDTIQIDKISTLYTTFKTDNIEYFSRAGKCTAIIEGVVYRLWSSGNAENRGFYVMNDDESLNYYYGTEKASIIWCEKNPKTINGKDVQWLTVGKQGKVMLKTDFSSNKGVFGFVKTNDSTSELYRDATLSKIPLIYAEETASRPTTDLVIGQCIFDTTLNKPIWWNGELWIDANGNNV